MLGSVQPQESNPVPQDKSSQCNFPLRETATGQAAAKGWETLLGAALVKQWRRFPGPGAVEQPVVPWQLSGHCSASENNRWFPGDVL